MLTVALTVAVVALVFLTSALSAQDSTGVADAEKFRLLHNSLRELSKDYGNDVLKTIGSLLLVIGWLVVSEGSRKFFAQNVMAWRTALVVLPVMAVTNTVWLIERFSASKGKVKVLDELGYVPNAYYADDRITPVLMVANIVLHLALFVMLFALVYSQQKARSDVWAGPPSS